MRTIRSEYAANRALCSTSQPQAPASYIPPVSLLYVRKLRQQRRREAMARWGYRIGAMMAPVCLFMIATH